jgi:hypothetical protein
MAAGVRALPRNRHIARRHRHTGTLPPCRLIYILALVLVILYIANVHLRIRIGWRARAFQRRLILDNPTHIHIRHSSSGATNLLPVNVKGQQAWLPVNFICMPITPSNVSVGIDSGVTGSIVHIGRRANSPLVLREIYLINCIANRPEKMSTFVSRLDLADACHLNEPTIPDVAGNLWINGSGMYAASITPHLQVQVTVTNPGSRSRVIVAVYGIIALRCRVRPGARVIAPLRFNSTRKLPERNSNRKVSRPNTLPLSRIDPGCQNGRTSRRISRWRHCRRRH